MEVASKRHRMKPMGRENTAIILRPLPVPTKNSVETTSRTVQGHFVPLKTLTLKTQDSKALIGLPTRGKSRVRPFPAR